MLSTNGWRLALLVGLSTMSNEPTLVWNRTVCAWAARGRLRHNRAAAPIRRTLFIRSHSQGLMAWLRWRAPPRGRAEGHETFIIVAPQKTGAKRRGDLRHFAEPAGITGRPKSVTMRPKCGPGGRRPPAQASSEAVECSVPDRPPKLAEPRHGRTQ